MNLLVVGELGRLSLCSLLEFGEEGSVEFGFSPLTPCLVHDLAVFVHVLFNDLSAESVFVRFNQATNYFDVECIRVYFRAEI